MLRKVPVLLPPLTEWARSLLLAKVTAVTLEKKVPGALLPRPLYWEGIEADSEGRDPALQSLATQFSLPSQPSRFGGNNPVH